ncbi:MAG TPA: hypothetical protein VKM54_15660 [Myxococcota bacterium]|nr:hypothetical protein [Myxococcota bacterium]
MTRKPTSATFVSSQREGNAKGVFTGAMLHGPMAITGKAAIHGFGKTLIDLPVQLGKTGSKFATSLTPSGGPLVAVTAVGGSWTAGVARVSAKTANGIVLVDQTRMGTNMLTAHGAGTLTLVTAVKVSASLTTVSPVVPTLGCSGPSLRSRRRCFR